MTRTALLIPLAAAAALAGCDNKDHTIIAGGPADDVNSAQNGPVVLPPSIVASKVYRCADNQIVHVDWMSDNKSATCRPGGAPPPQVAAAKPGKPMTGTGGFEVSGAANASSARIATPGHKSQSCKA